MERKPCDQAHQSFDRGARRLAALRSGCGRLRQQRKRRARRAARSNVLDTAGGVDSLDPGYWYYQSDYQELGNTTQRQLYGWKPDETKPTPDLAEALPEVSNGGKTVTIKIKSGIKYSPPLQNQTVKAADVKYALERCFLPQVGNGYANAYYGDIEGVKAFTDGKADEISGHPDARRPDARDQPFEAVRRHRERQRARHAVHGAGAEGLRPEVRQGQAVDLRPAPGLHRPVHDRERRQGQDHRLRAEQEADTGAQPELGQVDRLQAGLLRQDRRDVLHGRHGRGRGRRSPARTT